ncbi:MAG: hypothetical protein Q7U58_18310, partial [Hydrogenophaga sp.]|nr:hypothetical protein [Hydrogenophaga sp.]
MLTLTSEAARAALPFDRLIAALREHFTTTCEVPLRHVHEIASPGGKIEVSVHAAGELVPAFGVVDAIHGNTVEMAQTAPYYFTGKDP